MCQKKILIISGIVGPVKGSNQSFRNTLKGYLENGWKVLHLGFFSKKNSRYQIDDFFAFENYKFIGIPSGFEKIFKKLSFIFNINFKKKKISKFRKNYSFQNKSFENLLNEVGIKHMFFFILYGIFELIRGSFISIIFRPNIVYAYEVYSVIPSFIISKLLGIPFVKRFQGVYINNEHDLKSWKSWHLKFAYKLRSDLAIITNDGTRGYQIFVKLGFPKNRIVFLLNGIDERLVSLNCNNICRKHILEKYNLPYNSKILVILNRAYPAKRIDRAVYLLKALRDKEVPAFLIWAGAHGFLEEKIIEYAKKLNVHIFLKYLGPVVYEEALKILCISDLNLILNDRANLGNQILEAAWLGVPTLATDDGTNSKIIKVPNIKYVKPEFFETLGPKMAMEILSGGVKRTHFKPKVIYSWEKRMKIEIRLIEKLIKSN